VAQGEGPAFKPQYLKNKKYTMEGFNIGMETTKERFS
jgi:hypothetical protein